MPLSDPPPTNPTSPTMVIDPVLPFTPPSSGPGHIPVPGSGTYRPPGTGPEDMRPPPRVSFIPPKYPLGPTILMEPGFGGAPGIEYTPIIPPSMTPPPYLPGQPIPPGQPPAWGGASINGVPNSLRPPYPWEPFMWDPSWNPAAAGGGYPRLIPNPTFDPTYPVPPNLPNGSYRPSIPLPMAPASPLAPGEPPGLPIEIGALTRPPGSASIWPGILGVGRFVLGVAGAVASVAQMFVPGGHEPPAGETCLKSFLRRLGFQFTESGAWPEDGDLFIEGLKINRDNPAALQTRIQAAVQAACDRATNTSAVLALVSYGGDCAAFSANFLMAVKICKCKKAPPDTSAISDRIAALINTIKGWEDQEYTMLRKQMEDQIQSAKDSAAAYDADGSRFCRDKWKAIADAIQAMLDARVFKVTWFDCKRGLARLTIPTCDNQISIDETNKYIDAVEAVATGALARFWTAWGEWLFYKANTVDPSTQGCPRTPPPSPPPPPPPLTPPPYDEEDPQWDWRFPGDTVPIGTRYPDFVTH